MLATRLHSFVLTRNSIRTLATATKSTAAKTTKPRKSDIPAKPKRPQSAFFVFASQVDAANVTEGLSGIYAQQARVKYAAELWGGLTESEKEPFEAKAQNLKQDYEKQLAAYHQKYPPKPPRARNAYAFYIQDQLPRLKQANPDANVKDCMAQAGADWKQLNESAKSRYFTAAEKDKQRYASEMQKYEQSRA
eukprot:TRINITY_DN80486_c0_g1_i1.p1 TRINITY_DN80486_c0_g1~~TRINITY_DN80486_c0_g1_i1.p1  ORF type:complete len:192 (-),score=26.43 TRINITY_DN80486_c0_g1_i1:100-675(-)